jgi:hypothetical protein
MGVRLFSTNTVTTRIAQTAKRVTIFKWVVCAKLCDTLIIDIQSHDGYKRPPFQRSNSTLQILLSKMKSFSIFFLLLVSLVVAAVSCLTFSIFILKALASFYLKCSDQLVNYS